MQSSTRTKRVHEATAVGGLVKTGVAQAAYEDRSAPPRGAHKAVKVTLLLGIKICGLWLWQIQMAFAKLMYDLLVLRMFVKP